jgi:hypothetical protein
MLGRALRETGESVRAHAAFESATQHLQGACTYPAEPLSIT